MKLEFENKKLKELCEIEKQARRELGAVAAKKLQSRLADIVAADCVGDLVLGKPHPLTGDRTGQFALTLHRGLRLVFEPKMDEVPITDEKAIIWKDVTGVNIVFIGDYHD